MPSNNPPRYAPLLSGEDKILLSATSAASFQDIVSRAEAELGATVIVADSLHYVLALSSDLQAAFSELPSWLDLIERGYVPPVAKASQRAESVHDLHQLAVEQISETLTIHDALATLTGQVCTMCDIQDEGSTVLKLAVTTPQPLSDAQRRMVLTLSAALHLAYFRLGIASNVNNRGRHLLSLIQTGQLSPDTDESVLNGFDLNGPFCLACFQTQHLGIHNLSFITKFANLNYSPYLLVAMAGDIYVLLFNTQAEITPILEQLHRFAWEHQFPILLSRSFQDISETSSQFRQISDAAGLAIRFQGARGIQRWTDYSLFLMFQQLRSQGQSDCFFHGDAQLLDRHDREKNTQYAETVFCYLLHNCEAPATASALYIHRNTLDKRLRKIETLVAADWRSPSYRFRMLFSLFQLLDQQNLLTFYDIKETWR